MGTINVGVPTSAYSLVTRPDIGRDGLAGTADDGTMTLWNQNAATLGQDRLLTTNSAALNQLYRGIEITAAKRFSHGWQVLTGYTYARSIANATTVTNPNTLINSRGPTAYDRPHTFKVTGSYTLPYDFVVSGNLRMQSGPPVTRTATYALTQGNVTVNVEPTGNDRLDPLRTIDARLSKIFKLNRRQLEVMLDAYNLTNANTTWAVRTLTGRINVVDGGVAGGTIINQPQYLSPISILPPRIVRFSAAFRF